MLTDDDVKLPMPNPIWDYLLYGLNMIIAFWELTVIYRCLIN